MILSLYAPWRMMMLVPTPIGIVRSPRGPMCITAPFVTRGTSSSAKDVARRMYGARQAKSRCPSRGEGSCSMDGSDGFMRAPACAKYACHVAHLRQAQTTTSSGVSDGRDELFCKRVEQH